MLLLVSAWTFEVGLPSEAGIPELWDNTVPVINGTGAGTICYFSPQRGPEGTVSVSRYCTGAFYYTDKPERLGYGSRLRPNFQTGTSETQGRVYAVVPQTELADQSDMRGLFPLSQECCLNLDA